MPQTNQRGKKQLQQKNDSASGFPGLKATKSNDTVPAAIPKTQYEQLQEEELLVLGSMYPEEFRLIEKNQGAWKVIESLPKFIHAN